MQAAGVKFLRTMKE